MKTLTWILSTKKDLMKFPKLAIKSFGYGLHQAQDGAYPDIGKTLKGFGSADVIELKENDRNGTFRVVYTVRFPDTIFVLHAFQKKSKSGIKTPKEDLELIKSRLKRAQEIYIKLKKDRL